LGVLLQAMPMLNNSSSTPRYTYSLAFIESLLMSENPFPIV
jgi:hypothetical protein